MYKRQALATGIWFNNSPEALDVTISPEQQELIANHEFEQYYSSQGAGQFAAQVQTNNIQVSLLALAGGATAGTLTVAVLLSNGFSLGAVGALMHQNDAAGTFWGLILPHGLLEISAIIVAGAVAYRFVVGHIEMAPTRLSKANTFLEFGVLALAMAAAGQLIGTGAWLMPLFVLLFASVLVSGAHYVWVWRRKAAEEGGG